MPKEVKEESKKKMMVVEEVTSEKVNEPAVEEIKAEEKVESKEVAQSTDVSTIPPVEQPEEDTEKTNYLWIIVPTALLIGALVGGLITYFSGISKLAPSAVPSPESTIEPTVSPTPTPTPASSIKRETLKLQVLNGSGVSGLAGKAKTYLEGLGYKDVQTGNASKSNLLETTVSVKAAQKSAVETVIADLSKNYKVANETEVLPETSKYDFVINLGSK